MNAGQWLNFSFHLARAPIHISIMRIISCECLKNEMIL